MYSLLSCRETIILNDCIPHSLLLKNCLAQLNVSDFSGNLWLDAFNESAAVVLGMDAQQLGEMKEKAS